MKRGTHKGFTLIELLVVVAILAILAAIAVPNFLEAMARAKVSRVSSDLRAAATCLEAYRIDNNAYPEPLRALSTPIAYASDAYAPDVFANPEGWFALGYLQGQVGSQAQFLQDFGVTGATPAERHALASHQYFVFSNGPDLLDEALESPNTAFRDVIGAPGAKLGYFYDATNGTTSRGDILRTSKHKPE
jgi:type II secretion system protein G